MRRPKTLKSKLAQGGPSGLNPLRSNGSHDGRQEAGLLERRQKMLKGELENISRKPRDLVKNWPNDRLKESTYSCSE